MYSLLLPAITVYQSKTSLTRFVLFAHQKFIFFSLSRVTLARFSRCKSHDGGSLHTYKKSTRTGNVPFLGARHCSHLRAVPLCLPEKGIRGTAGEGLHRSGLAGKAQDCGAMDHQRREGGIYQPKDICPKTGDILL